MWHQLTLTSIPTASIEIISSLLESNGALSITLEDADDTPIFEPSPGAMPLWHEVNLTALYQNKDALTDALTLISTLFPTLSYSHIEFEDKAWERECLNAFKPMSFGDNLRIYPSWSVPDNLKSTDILLDPGLAFGTGAHPTTALCLSWLDKHPLNNQTVIDMGTGSGILTIAALKMGAAHVTAIDIDEQALTATKANVCQNQLSLNQVSMMFPNPSAYPKADLIIANILLGALLELKPIFIQASIDNHTTLLLSGILTEQVPELIEAYSPHFKVVAIDTKEDWAMVHCQRTA